MSGQTLERAFEVHVEEVPLAPARPVVVEW